MFGRPATPTIITGPSSVCGFLSGISFSIDSVEGATSYTWIAPPGCSIDSGQGTTHIVVDWDSLPGNVIVVATNSCGTSDSTSIFVGITSCRLAQPIRSYNGNNGFTSGDIKVYPNPTTGNVTVVYHLNNNKGVFQLYDILGRIVGSYPLDGNKNAYEFDASYLCCGVFQYIVLENAAVKGEGKIIILK